MTAEQRNTARRRVLAMIEELEKAKGDYYSSMPGDRSPALARSYMIASSNFSEVAELVKQLLEDAPAEAPKGATDGK